MTKIKICRVKDIFTARICGELGVDFLGLQSVKDFDTKDVILYNNIINDCNDFYSSTQSVLVTKINNVETLVDLIKQCPFSFVQLHFEISREDAIIIQSRLKQIDSEIKFIFVLAPNYNNVIKMANEIKDLADYFLFDSSSKGGTGVRTDKDWVKEIIKIINPIPYFLAGGLSVENVNDAIEGLDVFGVDVQSKLEMWDYGPKDPVLLEKFVQNVQPNVTITDIRSIVNKIDKRRTYISLALTNVPQEDLSDTIKKFKVTSVNNIHLDFSDESIAPGFISDPIYILTNMRKDIPSAFYCIHLFIDSFEKQVNIISECLSINPMLRMVYFHCKKWTDFNKEKFEKFYQYTIHNQLNVGFTIQATGIHFNEVEEMLEYLHTYKIFEYSLITRSSKHTLDEIKENDLPLLVKISDWLKAKNKSVCLSVDRDITVPKLKILQLGRPNHVIIGKELLALEEPDKTIKEIRSLLTPINHR